jgi:hypothetical protein
LDKKWDYRGPMGGRRDGVKCELALKQCMCIDQHVDHSVQQLLDNIMLDAQMSLCCALSTTNE